MRTPLSVEQFVSGKPGRALLENVFAVYLPKDGLWITGGAGQYAWSEGSSQGMRGVAHPVGDTHFIAATMHQSAIAHSMNRDAGMAVIVIGPGKLRVSKLGLFGYGRWMTIRWLHEEQKFEILAPLQKQEKGNANKR